MEAWYNVRDVASDAKVPKVMSMVTIKRFLSKAIAVMRGPLCVDNGFVSSSDWQAGCEEASMITGLYRKRSTRPGCVFYVLPGESRDFFWS